jgi:NDP-sugar pyrophosphorylase family protein
LRNAAGLVTSENVLIMNGDSYTDANFRHFVTELEAELFRRWRAESRNIRAFAWLGSCINIGTPERYWSAQEVLGNIEDGESAPQSGGHI